jgi:hypothetical protein
LGTLPTVVPNDIRRVCQRICMYELDQALNNTYAQKSRTQQIGSATSEITSMDMGFVDRELKRLHRYRRLVI